jgi:hypothetical protein
LNSQQFIFNNLLFCVLFSIGIGRKKLELKKVRKPGKGRGNPLIEDLP